MISYLFSLGLVAPGARFSRLEEPRAAVLFFVGVFLEALLDRLLNQEADFVMR